jgi:integrase
VYNEELTAIKLKAEQLAFKMGRENNLTANLLAEEFRGSKPTDFVKFTEEYIDFLKVTGSVRRSKQTTVILNKIIEYADSPSIEFNDINADFLDGLQLYMKNKVKNHPNTIRKDFERLKMIFSEADKRGDLSQNVFLKYKLPPRIKTKKEALSYEQIQAIINLELEPNSKQYHARNYFLFSFYNAGIRFGDICCLKWSHIQDGRLKYQMSKSKNNGTPKFKNIRLAEQSYEILKDYRTHGSEDDFIFPILGPGVDINNPVQFDKIKSRRNVMINKFLKQIAKLAGIDLSISFHIARHSFARHAANMGMNVVAISDALAHSDLKTTQIYLSGFNETLLDKEMESIFK